MRIAIVALLALPLGAQTPLSLKGAVRLALEKHPSIEAVGVEVKAAETRIPQARSGCLPTLNHSESWQRSDSPVFVFSSLLTQVSFRVALEADRQRFINRGGANWFAGASLLLSRMTVPVVYYIVNRRRVQA